MDALSLATDGIICPTGITINGITRCVIPFNLHLTTDVFNFNLKLKNIINLNAILDKKKINLLKIQTNLNSKLSNKTKINLKKCEDS